MNRTTMMHTDFATAEKCGVIEIMRTFSRIYNASESISDKQMLSLVLYQRSLMNNDDSIRNAYDNLYMSLSTNLTNSGGKNEH